jgi:ABC-type uncharacterized transport system YnjBCD permease subunit
MVMHYEKTWMEFWFFVLMLIGVLIALAAPSAAISYLMIFISGMFAGRLIYERKHKFKFPYLVIIAGFIIGYVAGAYYGSRKMIFVLFIVGAIASHYLYDKKVLKDSRF